MNARSIEEDNPVIKGHKIGPGTTDRPDKKESQMVLQIKDRKITLAIPQCRTLMLGSHSTSSLQRREGWKEGEIGRESDNDRERGIRGRGVDVGRGHEFPTFPGGSAQHTIGFMSSG